MRPMTELSLRERSRARRRAAIERAAMELFAEHGYDGTTVAQIADAAEVAARTVSLYFPSKFDLALSYTTSASLRLGEAMAARSDDDATLDVMVRWMHDEIRDHRESMDRQRAVLRANPSLRGAETGETIGVRASIAAALAKELDRRADDPIVVLVGGAYEGIVATLIQLGPDDDETFAVATRLLRSAMKTAKATAGGRR